MKYKNGNEKVYIFSFLLLVAFENKNHKSNNEMKANEDECF